MYYTQHPGLYNWSITHSFAVDTALTEFHSAFPSDPGVVVVTQVIVCNVPLTTICITVVSFISWKWVPPSCQVDSFTMASDIFQPLRFARLTSFRKKTLQYLCSIELQLFDKPLFHFHFKFANLTCTIAASETRKYTCSLVNIWLPLLFSPPIWNV